MMDCKVWIKDFMENVKSRFDEYKDLKFEKREEWIVVKDLTYLQFLGWDISTWIELAGDNELIYAYYDDYLNVEFVHIREGHCLRAYMEYENEVDTDEGDNPEISISGWLDVIEYLDKHTV